MMMNIETMFVVLFEISKLFAWLIYAPLPSRRRESLDINRPTKRFENSDLSLGRDIKFDREEESETRTGNKIH